MTDTPLRFYGPQPLDSNAGLTLYTVDTRAQKAFIRDLTFSNTSGSAIHVHASIGSISDPSKRVIDQDMPANTATFIRPLWLMDPGETLQALQVIASVPTLTATAGGVLDPADRTAYTTASWTPAANTLYILTVENGVASGTTALNPSSITGTQGGTWTLINQTTSTVAAAQNVGVAAYYYYSGASPGSGTTVVNFASTQHSCVAQSFSVANTYSGATSVPPWTSSATPIVQSAVAADTTAPASTSNLLTVTLPSAVQTGQVIYFGARVGSSAATTPPTSFTEPASGDFALADATGSVAPLLGDVAYPTTPPWTSSTVGPSTSSALTTARASIAFELVPAAFVNCMVNGIEVRP